MRPSLVRLMRLMLHGPGEVRVMESATAQSERYFCRVEERGIRRTCASFPGDVSWNYKDNLSHHEHRPTPPAASHGQEYLDGADMTVIVVHLIQKTNAMRDHLEFFSAEMSHLQRRLTILLHGGERRKWRRVYDFLYDITQRTLEDFQRQRSPPPRVPLYPAKSGSMRYRNLSLNARNSLYAMRW